jgi:hypothetical protein
MGWDGDGDGVMSGSVRFNLIFLAAIAVSLFSRIRTFYIYNFGEDYLE